MLFGQPKFEMIYQLRYSLKCLRVVPTFEEKDRIFVLVVIYFLQTNFNFLIPKFDGIFLSF